MLLMDDNEVSFLIHNNVLSRVYICYLIVSVMLEFNLGKHHSTCFTDEKLREAECLRRKSMVKSADFTVRVMLGH